jgi:hypothetical protein
LTDLALITAAAYKSVSYEIPNVGKMCPAPLLPVGDETILSRQVRQWGKHGIKSVIGVGVPGSLYPIRTEWYSRHYKYEYDPDISHMSPWTWDRVDYVKALGLPVLIHDADKDTPHGTFEKLIDVVGRDWRRVFLSHGDQVYTDDAVDYIASFHRSVQVRRSDKRRSQCVMVLSPGTADLWKRLFPARNRRFGAPCWHGSKHNLYGSKGGMKFAGEVPMVNLDEVDGFHFESMAQDIDCPGHYYSLINDWLPKYG